LNRLRGNCKSMMLKIAICAPRLDDPFLATALLAY
jgi:hypothetical protein